MQVNSRVFRSLLALVLLLSSASIGGERAIAQKLGPVLLTVSGEVAQSLKLTADDLSKLPHRTINAKDHNGKD